MATKWEQRGQQLAEALKGMTDNHQIKEFSSALITEIIEAYPDSPNSRKSPLSAVRKAILAAFPDTKERENGNQYFTEKGKGNIPRYQHLALNFLTFPKEDWDALGDNSRQEYQQAIESKQAHLSADMINIQDIDTEALQEIKVAAESLKISLQEFFIKAAKDSAKAINNKRKKYSTHDIAAVPTKDLLENINNEYKTHPDRIEELTKRAVRAIQIHNDDATEESQKYFISATAINALTGSRTSAISKILANFEGAIADHNVKHGLTSITNRGSKRNINDEIDLVALVPDGMDL